jgi:hypothetical protein
MSRTHKRARWGRAGDGARAPPVYVGGEDHEVVVDEREHVFRADDLTGKLANHQNDEYHGKPRPTEHRLEP